MELLGLASFNVFLALILTTAFLSQRESTAVDGLSETSIAAFVQETTDISSGKRTDMDAYGITTYFMEHVTDDGKFTTTISFEAPGGSGTQEKVMEMDKMSFISNLIQGLHSMEDHEAAVKIENITLADDGKSAKILTTTIERGMMPVDDGSGGSTLTPVTGNSYCEQNIVLGKKNIIQMAGAVCTTNISASPAL